MYGIEVLHHRDGSMTVGLRGEFDLSAIDELRETLGNLASLRCPTIIDLSEVTFMDIQCTRELAVRSQLYAHHVTLLDPSWQVRATIRACDLTDWILLADRDKEFLEKVG